MGLEGLLGYLVSSNISKKKCAIVPRSCVLIDGHEYAQHLIQEARIRNINFLPELGGDYDALDNILREDANLLKSSELNITIYFCVDACTKEISSYNNLPIPKLFLPQLEATFHSLGITIVHTATKVSSEMAKDCVRANCCAEKSMQEVVTFCYGNNM